MADEFITTNIGTATGAATIPLTVVAGSVANSSSVIYSERPIPSAPAPGIVYVDVAAISKTRLTLSLFFDTADKCLTLDAQRGRPGTLHSPFYSGSAQLISASLASAAAMGQSNGSAVFLLGV